MTRYQHIIITQSLLLTFGFTLLVVQSHSCTNLCNPTDCSMPGFCVLHHLLEFAQTEIHWVSDAILPSHPLSSPSPPVLNFSRHQSLFQWIGSSHQVPRVLELRFSISTSKEYSRLSSLKIDWFDLLPVQGTLKRLLQHHSSKVSILHHSAFFMIQHLHSYRTTGKTTALTIQTFVGKVMSLLFNMLSRLVIAFLSRSKCLLILWLQLWPAVILEPK